MKCLFGWIKKAGRYYIEKHAELYSNIDPRYIRTIF